MNELSYHTLSECHADGLLHIWADADVIRYTNMHLPCTLEDVKKRIELFKSWDVFAVIQAGNLIGVIGCPPINQGLEQFGLFYQFCKSSWGQGHASIATQWLLTHMKQKYPNATLFADVAVDNVASEKILQKLGFQLISEELLDRDGKTFTVHNYKK